MITSFEQQDVRINDKLTNNFAKQLERLGCDDLARELGATKRTPRKCSAVNLLVSFMAMISHGRCSYNIWAMFLSQLIDDTISKKAIEKRVNHLLVQLAKGLLEAALKVHHEKIVDPVLFSGFKRVLLHDATHLGLPKYMSHVFPGSKNGHGESAVAKIQAVFEMLTGNFIDIHLGSFRDTDLVDASRANQDVRKGDLVIRDLGYLSLISLDEIISKGASFVNQIRSNWIISRECNGHRIDMLKELTKHKSLDIDVFLGAKNTIKCRLVSVKLGEKAAAERRRKAKMNAHKNRQPSKEKLKLLGYDIFITDVPREKWSSEKVVQVYANRWYIEILFKAWKNGMGIEKDIPNNYLDKDRVELYLYMRMLQIVLLIMPLYHITSRLAFAKGRQISIVSVTKYIIDHICITTLIDSLPKHIERILYYCSYEHRKDRTNHIERLITGSS